MKSNVSYIPLVRMCNEMHIVGQSAAMGSLLGYRYEDGYPVLVTKLSVREV